MTETFQRFLRQYNSQGSDYGDGYSPADFDGLTPEEMDRASKMLAEQAAKGDGVAVDGLGRMGTPGARDLLLKLLPATGTSGESHSDVCAALWWITRDVRWQAELVNDVRSADEQLVKHALIQLVSTIETEMPQDLEHTMTELLVSSDNSVVKSQAIEALLKSRGIPPLVTGPSSEIFGLTRSLMAATRANVGELLAEADDLKSAIGRSRDE